MQCQKTLIETMLETMQKQNECMAATLSGINSRLQPTEEKESDMAFKIIGQRGRIKTLEQRVLALEMKMSAMQAEEQKLKKQNKEQQ